MNKKIMLLMLLSGITSVVTSIAYTTLIRKIYMKVSFIDFLFDCIVIYVAYTIGRKSM